MDSTLLDNLKPPRFETSKPLLVAGIAERCTHENEGAGIPNQWQQFHHKVDAIPARIGNVAYGVCCNGDDAGNFDYVAGVEVADFSDLPREFARVRIPEQKYAVFTHAEHISTIRRTINTIWNHWLPISGMKAADAPSFERYDEKFDPATGNGGLEIWVPVRE
jgi:AraC family transcriptional regulator